MICGKEEYLEYSQKLLEGRVENTFPIMGISDVAEMSQRLHNFSPGVHQKKGQREYRGMHSHAG
ncbi:hypothetical protein EYF88_15755 [Paracoccus sediminis]|uniref:Uncharacterized protein n=1 Tax=Paracoccus sediminis TaxID=1214787 RepID=A0ABY1YF17_9RHOB|nr:hypothetical protein [Paracoccus sediminis]TBN46970.1 hypothetical protein EYF88_15755 [Paracoccus sediminis]